MCGIIPYKEGKIFVSKDKHSVQFAIVHLFFMTTGNVRVELLSSGGLGIDSPHWSYLSDRFKPLDNIKQYKKLGSILKRRVSEGRSIGKFQEYFSTCYPKLRE